MNDKMIKKCEDQEANPEIVESLVELGKDSVHYNTCTDNELTLSISSVRSGDWFENN